MILLENSVHSRQAALNKNNYINSIIVKEAAIAFNLSGKSVFLSTSCIHSATDFLELDEIKALTIGRTLFCYD